VSGDRRVIVVSVFLVTKEQIDRYVGWASTINIMCIKLFFCREVTRYTVCIGIQFWPTLQIRHEIER
jgi:hypothetical protein